MVVDFLNPISAVIPGARGRVLEVLTGTTAELSVRAIARLAGVSPAQASRVLPELVDLGLVERREVPPSSQFRLVRTNVASRLLIELSQSRHSALGQIGGAAAALAPPPLSVIVFGSFARGEADADSDLDVVVVRPDQVADDDDEWSASIEGWRQEARAIAGNPVEIVEVDRAEAARKLHSDSTLWLDVVRDGVVIHGLDVTELSEGVHA